MEFVMPPSYKETVEENTHTVFLMGCIGEHEQRYNNNITNEEIQMIEYLTRRGLLS